MQTRGYLAITEAGHGQWQRSGGDACLILEMTTGKSMALIKTSLGLIQIMKSHFYKQQTQFSDVTCHCIQPDMLNTTIAPRASENFAKETNE